jgi:hypothetical protein
MSTQRSHEQDVGKLVCDTDINRLLAIDIPAGGTDCRARAFSHRRSRRGSCSALSEPRFRDVEVRRRG